MELYWNWMSNVITERTTEVGMHEDGLRFTVPWADELRARGEALPRGLLGPAEAAGEP